MKKKIYALFVILTLVFVMSFSAFAETSGKQQLVDQTGVLKNGTEIENSLNKLSQLYNVDFVVAFVNISDDQDVKYVADDFYMTNGYGGGSERDGIMFFVNFYNNTYYIYVRGEAARVCTDYGMGLIENEVLPFLKDHDFDGAAKAFIDQADYLFCQEAAGNIIDVYTSAESGSESEGMGLSRILVCIVVSLIIGFIISLIITGSMKSKMKSVRFQSNANVYQSNISITKNTDRYLYHNVVVVPIPKDNDNHGSSGGGTTMHSSSHGGSFGGRGGSF